MRHKLFAVLLASVVSLARALLRLPQIFGDHMVLSAAGPAAIFGTSHPGETITAWVDADGDTDRQGADTNPDADVERLNEVRGSGRSGSHFSSLSSQSSYPSIFLEPGNSTSVTADPSSGRWVLHLVPPADTEQMGDADGGPTSIQSRSNTIAASRRRMATAAAVHPSSHAPRVGSDSDSDAAFSSSSSFSQPFTLHLSDASGHTITFRDVSFGLVLLCGGGGNMAVPMRLARAQAASELAEGRDGGIRFHAPDDVRMLMDGEYGMENRDIRLFAAGIGSSHTGHAHPHHDRLPATGAWGWNRQGLDVPVELLSSDMVVDTAAAAAGRTSDDNADAASAGIGSMATEGAGSRSAAPPSAVDILAESISDPRQSSERGAGIALDAVVAAEPESPLGRVAAGTDTGDVGLGASSSAGGSSGTGRADADIHRPMAANVWHVATPNKLEDFSATCYLSALQYAKLAHMHQSGSGSAIGLIQVAVGASSLQQWLSPDDGDSDGTGHGGSKCGGRLPADSAAQSAAPSSMETMLEQQPDTNTDRLGTGNAGSAADGEAAASQPSGYAHLQDGIFGPGQEGYEEVMGRRVVGGKGADEPPDLTANAIPSPLPRHPYTDERDAWLSLGRPLVGSTADSLLRPGCPPSIVSDERSGLLRAMVQPVAGYPVSAVIWMGGERDAELHVREEVHACELKALVTRWRDGWERALSTTKTSSSERSGSHAGGAAAATTPAAADAAGSVLPFVAIQLPSLPRGPSFNSSAVRSAQARVFACGDGGDNGRLAQSNRQHNGDVAPHHHKRWYDPRATDHSSSEAAMDEPAAPATASSAHSIKNDAFGSSAAATDSLTRADDCLPHATLVPSMDLSYAHTMYGIDRIGLAQRVAGGMQRVLCTASAPSTPSRASAPLSSGTSQSLNGVRSNTICIHRAVAFTSALTRALLHSPHNHPSPLQAEGARGHNLEVDAAAEAAGGGFRDQSEASDDVDEAGATATRLFGSDLHEFVRFAGAEDMEFLPGIVEEDKGGDLASAAARAWKAAGTKVRMVVAKARKSMAKAVMRIGGSNNNREAGESEGMKSKQRHRYRVEDHLLLEEGVILTFSGLQQQQNRGLQGDDNSPSSSSSPSSTAASLINASRCIALQPTLACTSLPALSSCCGIGTESGSTVIQFGLSADGPWYPSVVHVATPEDGHWLRMVNLAHGHHIYGLPDDDSTAMEPDAAAAAADAAASPATSRARASQFQRKTREKRRQHQVSCPQAVVAVPLCRKAKEKSKRGGVASKPETIDFRSTTADAGDGSSSSSSSSGRLHHHHQQNIRRGKEDLGSIMHLPLPPCPSADDQPQVSAPSAGQQKQQQKRQAPNQPMFTHVRYGAANEPHCLLRAVAFDTLNSGRHVVRGSKHRAAGSDGKDRGSGGRASSSQPRSCSGISCESRQQQPDPYDGALFSLPIPVLPTVLPIEAAYSEEVVPYVDARAPYSGASAAGSGAGAGETGSGAAAQSKPAKAKPSILMMLHKWLEIQPPFAAAADVPQSAAEVMVEEGLSDGVLYGAQQQDTSVTRSVRAADLRTSMPARLSVIEDPAGDATEAAILMGAAGQGHREDTHVDQRHNQKHLHRDDGSHGGSDAVDPDELLGRHHKHGEILPGRERPSHLRARHSREDADQGHRHEQFNEHGHHGHDAHPALHQHQHHDQHHRQQVHHVDVDIAGSPLPKLRPWLPGQDDDAGGSGSGSGSVGGNGAGSSGTGTAGVRGEGPSRGVEDAIPSDFDAYPYDAAPPVDTQHHHHVHTHPDGTTGSLEEEERELSAARAPIPDIASMPSAAVKHQNAAEFAAGNPDFEVRAGLEITPEELPSDEGGSSSSTEVAGAESSALSGSPAANASPSVLLEESRRHLAIVEAEIESRIGTLHTAHPSMGAASDPRHRVNVEIDGRGSVHAHAAPVHSGYSPDHHADAGTTGKAGDTIDPAAAARTIITIATGGETDHDVVARTAAEAAGGLGGVSGDAYDARPHVHPVHSTMTEPERLSHLHEDASHHSHPDDRHHARARHVYTPTDHAERDVEIVVRAAAEAEGGLGGVSSDCYDAHAHPHPMHLTITEPIALLQEEGLEVDGAAARRQAAQALSHDQQTRLIMAQIRGDVPPQQQPPPVSQWLPFVLSVVLGPSLAAFFIWHARSLLAKRSMSVAMKRLQAAGQAPTPAHVLAAAAEASGHRLQLSQAQEVAGTALKAAGLRNTHSSMRPEALDAMMTNPEVQRLVVPRLGSIPSAAVAAAAAEVGLQLAPPPGAAAADRGGSRARAASRGTASSASQASLGAAGPEYSHRLGTPTGIRPLQLSSIFPIPGGGGYGDSADSLWQPLSYTYHEDAYLAQVASGRSAESGESAESGLTIGTAVSSETAGSTVSASTAVSSGSASDTGARGRQRSSSKASSKRKASTGTGRSRPSSKGAAPSVKAGGHRGPGAAVRHR